MHPRPAAVPPPPARGRRFGPRARAAALITIIALAVIACEATNPPPTTTTTTTLASGGIDPTHLPLGDGKYGSTAKVGSIKTCQSTFGGGGASSRGPWFNTDGTTWDSTKKLTVSGSVAWTSTFSTTISGSYRVFTGNDLPSHATGKFPIPASDPVHAYDGNPNSISSQAMNAKVPANPTAAATPTCIHGEVGILLSGVALFDGLDAGGRDAVAWEAQDSCEGHPQNTGVYHYHEVTSCLSTPKDKATLVGWAYDGFPIFVERTATGALPTNADLDVCHGRTSAVPLDGRTVTMYHYSATLEYPYTVGCFKGTPIADRFSG